jgi:hypothetical protein
VTTDELRRKDHGLGGNTQDLGWSMSTDRSQELLV